MLLVTGQTTDLRQVDLVRVKRIHACRPCPVGGVAHTGIQHAPYRAEILWWRDPRRLLESGCYPPGSVRCSTNRSVIRQLGRESRRRRTSCRIADDVAHDQRKEDRDRRRLKHGSWESEAGDVRRHVVGCG